MKRSSSITSSSSSNHTTLFDEQNSVHDTSYLESTKYNSRSNRYHPKARLSSSHPLSSNKAASTFNLIESHLDSASSLLQDSNSLSTEMLSENEKNREKWRSLILLIPVRLGGEVFNPIYTESIKELFTHPACLGIIGGRPKHSLYFVGIQQDKLIYLDPHNDQEAIDANTSDFPLRSYHCDFPRKMSISRMDPSCTIGFYCPNRESFLELTNSVKDFIKPSHQKITYPFFVFEESSAPKNETKTNLEEKTVKIKHQFINAYGQVESEIDADEFVMI